MDFMLPTSLWPAVHGLANGSEWPPRTRPESEAFLDAANRHGLLPLLFEFATEMPDAVQEALPSWRAMLRAYEFRSKAHSAAIERLCTILQPIPFVFQKGSDYRLTLYPRPELRPMQDIDVLVPTATLEEAEELLCGAGIVRQRARGATERLPLHYERTYAIEDKILLEVHHRFVQRVRCNIDYEAMFARVVPLPIPIAHRLADGDSLVQHAFNMASDEFASPIGRYVDLWLLLRNRPHALAEALTAAREWQVERALYGALALAVRLFPELAAPNDLLTKRERHFLEKYVLPDPRRSRKDGSRARHLWQKFWLIDRPWRRLAFGGYQAYSLVRAALRGDVTR